MSSSQGSTFSTNMAGFVDGSSARKEVSYIDYLPVYVRELIAGGAAGAFAKTAVAPLERVKILLQTRTEGFQSLGVYQSLKKVLKHEGVLGFYKGNGVSVLRIVPYAALHFMTYEQYRLWILNNYPAFGSGPVVDLLAGSVAGGTAVLCTYPLDLARTKLAYQASRFHEYFFLEPGTSIMLALEVLKVNLWFQGACVSKCCTHSFNYFHCLSSFRLLKEIIVEDARGSLSCGVKSVYSRPMYGGIKDVLTTVYKEGGVRALYRGLGPTLTGILPYAGLKFYIYEELKSHVPEEHQKCIVMRLSCGALAGLLGQTFTYPLDVVRRQMQVESLQPSVQGDTRCRNTMEGLTTIARNQGWKQLFAGLSINYIKIVPSVAIGFTAYDMMKAWLHIPPRQKSKSASTG
ncbi:hypothetical protein SLEP1_g15910 [Rubroshorea leprosula]|uniref:Mitochondrial carrier protein n=1 Tax=Rubroshorea leprosula TaxID=152421 RepID=A0AAV5IYB6_9ROSI|nr:hypothetical protein SLEP1_g15910 [Rubroshorea leprosula]